MSTYQVSVSVDAVVNNQVQCTYTPPGPYEITKDTHDVVFTLDDASIRAGWSYTGTISNTGDGQLSITGSGSSVTVTDSDTEEGNISYELGMSQNGGPQRWSDPQNHNTGEG